MRLPMIVFALLLARTATADDHRHEADEHAQRGIALYKLGKYVEAIDEFEAAYVLYPSDTLLYNLGQSHRQLDHCREAIDYYRRFLDGQPDSPLAPKVSELIPPLEHACEVKYKKPVDVAVTVAAPAPPQAIEARTPEPSSEPPIDVRGGLGAGMLISNGVTSTPIGPDLAITRPWGDFAIGGELAAGWFPGAPGSTATAITARAILLYPIYRGDLDISVGGGVGFVVVANPTRMMSSGTLAIPELAGLGTISHQLGGGWDIALDLEAAAGASPSINGTVMGTFAAQLAVGLRR